jgi:hypothetical protein
MGDLESQFRLLREAILDEIKFNQIQLGPDTGMRDKL